MPNFRLEDYEPVEDRLAKFWADHPEGRVLTTISEHNGNDYIVRAEVFTDRADERPAATGYAQETVGASPVNKTSALENCETSAIGRALANLGYATKGKRPSREEMDKAARRERQPSHPARDPAVEFAELSELIAAASTKQELAVIGQRIASSAIRDEGREQLRLMYSARAKEVAA